MERELLIVAFFAVLALAHNRAHHKATTQVAAHSGFIAAVSHPAFLDTVRDYAIHFVVYSGYVFGH